MMEQTEIQKWVDRHPILQNIINKEEVLWMNPLIEETTKGIARLPVQAGDVQEATERLQRFAPYIAKVFPETKVADGIIESPITSIPTMKEALENDYNVKIPGTLFLKEDNALPISGSIKARGGIYEVLKHAETLALKHGLITKEENYERFAEEAFQAFFSNYKIAVGSTGNLGLSIGIMSAKLGFEVTVHMSSDAKQWKKEMLREKGVTVVEYEDDYSKAVEEGRRQAEADPSCHFVDDENSLDLFFGYAVAGERLAAQLKEAGTIVDQNHPLFVYLPCGVGGGPGGVAYGLKLAFGDSVHCFFAEPTHAPCMTIGMLTGLHDQVSVHDFGLDNETAADGLAVGTASGFVGKTMEPLLAGCCTVSDDTMFTLLRQLADTENIYVEPSALAGMTGPVQTIRNNISGANLETATHLVWATGGNMVPKEELAAYYERGK